ncbi:16S rRNA (cytosine(967)-C(5))-methyltransferase RsmB [Clostridium sp.]|uniref:16S rRNA (cytosine(967)-C(5))-methyltransferase RsmB n=1 Tax=Clostridium sp. TaxID=1506 RepID=UPI002FC7609B
MDNAREIATKVLYQVFYNKAYSNIVLGHELNNSNLSDKDKAFVTEIVYGTIKYKYSIDKILKKFLEKNFDKVDKFLLNVLRITIYQIRYLDKVPDFAAVNEAVNLTKKKLSLGASKVANGVLRNYLRNKESNYCSEGNVFEELAFKHSYPQWLVKLFLDQYGSEFGEKILVGLNERPSVTVRVNSMQKDYEEVLESLEANGYTIEEGAVCPEAIKIVKGRNIEENPLFKQGLITVQDESAMLVAPSMDIEEDITVLDLCSAPGGKTTHIGELMNNTGEILAFDIYDHKLELIKDNTNRLGLTNITLNLLDATKYQEELYEKADRVLIDVPCSGLGIIRKKPEIKYNKNLKELKTITKIQREIMKNAKEYVKLNGKVIYSTCTLNKDENEENIKWFLKEYPNFSIEPLYFGEAENIIYHEEGYVTILPNSHMDGFFIAKIRKNK